MKLASAIFLIAGVVLSGKTHAQQTTPAEQRIATARQQVAADPKKPEAYNNLALGFISRAAETESPDEDRQAAEALARLELEVGRLQQALAAVAKEVV